MDCKPFLLLNVNMLLSGKQTDVIYLDISNSKAFDKVSHAQLLCRLREFGLRGNVVNWFSSYLSNRYQETTVGGVTSRPLPATSGVPQGSILGPLLFLLYESHLSEIVRYSSIATFADDTKIFKTIHKVSDASLLQEDQTHFEKTSSKVNLILNAQKCKVSRLTKKHQKTEYPYKLHDVVLESTIHEWDLGVWTSPF